MSPHLLVTLTGFENPRSMWEGLILKHGQG